MSGADQDSWYDQELSAPERIDAVTVATLVAIAVVSVLAVGTWCFLMRGAGL